ncbi:MAG: penicillin acylase family protein [Sandaracinus sp.]
MNRRTLFSTLAASVLASACGSTPPAATDGGADGGADTGADSGTAMTIDTLPSSEELQIPGLEGNVEVVYDDRGMPHIYGGTLHDVFMVEGYLMSRDRFAQMEFIRRNVIGRLSEVLAGADPTLPSTDEENLALGYRRNGERIAAELRASTDPADVRTLALAQAFVDGINVYIDRVGDTENPATMGAEAINIITLQPAFGHWRVEDIFAMARFQSASLSYDAGSDVSRSQRLAAYLAAFGDAANPRRGMFADLFSDFPERAVFTREGFNNEPTDMGTTALVPPFGELPPRMALPPMQSLRAARGFFDRLDERWSRLGYGDEHRGSNNWLVAASLTANGHPILSNDPHLSLISPPIWWYAHLNTTHAQAAAEQAVDVEGVAFAGLPGVVLGFNQHLAWGATTTGYDVTDVYQEDITLGTGGAPDTVLFNGTQVAIEEDVQTFGVAGGADHTFTIERVPHHGVIIPGTRVASTPGHETALSVRYTGDDPSNELAYFIGLATASSVTEAQAAQQHFRVGSQNFIAVDAQHIRWSSQSRIPLRDARALTFTISGEGVPSGYNPLYVLPGTGEYEWVGDLDSRYIPHDQDPTRGWIATANQDNVGVTEDGNPCNDSHYLGGDFDLGLREHRIQERLAMLATRGNITTADMVTLQGTTTSETGQTMRDPLVAILANPTAAIPGLSTADQTRLADVHDRLAAWSLETPHGVGATDADVIADSIATTIFNVSISRIIPLALGDEAAMTGGIGGAQSVRWLDWALSDPTHLVTGDVLWDDLTTASTTETREEVVIRGVLAALDYLTTRLGADEQQWRWGRLHTVRFEGPLPASGLVSIPPEGDSTYPDGFPRHGDLGAVDVGNFGIWNTTNFSHGSGASQRLVVEMTPDGPLAFNALPGGQSIDVESPHHADEAMHWIANESPPLAFQEADVVAHFERRIDVHP